MEDGSGSFELPADPDGDFPDDFYAASDDDSDFETYKPKPKRKRSNKKTSQKTEGD